MKKLFQKLFTKNRILRIQSECEVRRIPITVNDKMTLKDKKAAFDGATGTYGVVDVGELFDAECVRLACAYYGGSNVCTMKVTDGDTTYDQLFDGVYDMLDEALFCDVCKDIIVQITTEVIDY